jgi:hypothetical protein
VLFTSQNQEGMMTPAEINVVKSALGTLKKIEALAEELRNAEKQEPTKNLEASFGVLKGHMGQCGRQLSNAAYRLRLSLELLAKIKSHTG